MTPLMWLALRDRRYMQLKEILETRALEIQSEDSVRESGLLGRWRGPRALGGVMAFVQGGRVWEMGLARGCGPRSVMTCAAAAAQPVPAWLAYPNPRHAQIRLARLAHSHPLHQCTDRHRRSGTHCTDGQLRQPPVLLLPTQGLDLWPLIKIIMG